MIKQKHLASTLVHYFKKLLLVIVLIFNYNIFHGLLADEAKKTDKIETINFPAAVIDMKLVLSNSSAFTTLQKEIQKLEKSYKEEI